MQTIKNTIVFKIDFNMHIKNQCNISSFVQIEKKKILLWDASSSLHYLIPYSFSLLMKVNEKKS